MQSQRNGIKEDDDDVKLPSAHIKKMQNTAEFGILARDRTAPSTKSAVDRKKVDISIRKVICITG